MVLLVLRVEENHLPNASKLSNVIISFLIGLVACSVDGGTELERDPTAPIQTDKLIYRAKYEHGEGVHRRYGFKLLARFSNPTTDTIFLAREYPDQNRPTYGVFIVRETGDVASGYDLVIVGVGHDLQIAVPPGSSRVDTLHLGGPNVWTEEMRDLEVYLQGRMRLKYMPQGCRGNPLECPLPDSLAISNVFEVRLE